MLLNTSISQIMNIVIFWQNIDDPTLKSIAKWRNHPRILAITSEYNNSKLSILFLNKKSNRSKSAGCLQSHSGE